MSRFGPPGGLVRKAPELPYAEPEMPAGWSATHEHLLLLSHRQQVLLAAHAARRVLHVFEEAYPDDDRPRKAVEAAEAWAHDPSPKNRQAARVAANACYHVYATIPNDTTFACVASAANAATDAAGAVSDAYSVYTAADAIFCAASAARDSDPDYHSSTWRSYQHASAPEGASFSPDWRTPEVLNLAQSIHDHEDWQGLPVLADALEEAGCSDQKILAPLRHGRNHTRASWALQQILHGGQ